MITGLAYAVIGLAAIATLWGLLTAVLNKPPGKAQLLFAAGLELVTLAQSLIAVVRIFSVQLPETATTVGYLIGIVVLVPVAWFWANSERTRFSGVVLAIAAFAVLAMTLRLLVLWVPVIP